MTIIGIQVLGVLFAGFMFYLTFLHQRRNEFTAKETLFWFGTWVAFLLLVIFPTTLDFFIKGVLGFSRKLDFFIVLGFMFLLGILFHTYIIMRKTQNRVEKLVRHMAIERKKK
ncbi:MAG: hypothetical protein CMH61_02805 [Nanoarchaeota archaeon]|nr:hypothetical protein [Nanoarchaeota archaeon]|tara:strand:- start:2397 stop:2735 length:339 start_codon:yes stop_codon:yes gene_type:complete